MHTSLSINVYLLYGKCGNAYKPFRAQTCEGRNSLFWATMENHQDFPSIVKKLPFFSLILDVHLF